MNVASNISTNIGRLALTATSNTFKLGCLGAQPLPSVILVVKRKLSQDNKNKYSHRKPRIRPIMSDTINQSCPIQNATAISELDINESKLLLKPPKGMRDFGAEQAWNRKRVFQIITECFEKHGAQPLDTPVAERREILDGKYGEESKLIFNLEKGEASDDDEDNDDGGEDNRPGPRKAKTKSESLSLRYDLTVPFARYLGMNKIQTMIRYHVGKVYRRDDVKVTKGRFREFYQCDIDFAGNYDLMMPDCECLEILCEILTAIDLPCDFSIKINHRAILNGMFEVAGVPKDKFKTICSSVDKLDKLCWDGVKKEMCTDKGLDEQVADKIGRFVCQSGGEELIDKLIQDELGQNEDAKRGLQEMKTLFKLANYNSIAKHLKFDLSLARGLDYYTGVIYEAVLLGDVGVGSIAAGGRYDNLVGSLLKDRNFHVPCVGLSVGVERLFAVLESQPVVKDNTSSPIHCYVGSIQFPKLQPAELEELLQKRYKIVKSLRQRGIRARNLLKTGLAPINFYNVCDANRVPFGVFFGPKDLKKNCVCLRDFATRTDEVVPIDELADRLAQHLKIS